MVTIREEWTKESKYIQKWTPKWNLLRRAPQHHRWGRNVYLETSIVHPGWVLTRQSHLNTTRCIPIITMTQGQGAMLQPQNSPASVQRKPRPDYPQLFRNSPTFSPILTCSFSEVSVFVASPEERVAETIEQKRLRRWQRNKWSGVGWGAEW